MANVNIYNMNGDVVGSMELNDKIFGVEVNKSVLHSVVRAYLLNQRQGTQSTLTRTEVSGGGRKPWRQKGTGRARQGSTRSPQWTHGGIALGPKPRSYRTGLNKKTRRAALFGALSAKVAEGKLIVLDDLTCTEYKTRPMVTMLNALGVDSRALIVMPEVNPFAVKSCANLPRVETSLATNLNVYEVMKADKMVITAAAVKKLEEVYNK